MSPNGRDVTAGKSTKNLAVDVALDSALLAKLEFELAKAKAQDALTTVGIGILYIVLGASLLTGAIIALLASAVAALHPHFPLWVSALGVSVITLVLALVFIKLAQQRLKNATRGETAPEIEPDVPELDDVTP